MENTIKLYKVIVAPKEPIWHDWKAGQYYSTLEDVQKAVSEAVVEIERTRANLYVRYEAVQAKVTESK